MEFDDLNASRSRSSSGSHGVVTQESARGTAIACAAGIVFSFGFSWAFAQLLFLIALSSEGAAYGVWMAGLICGIILTGGCAVFFYALGSECGVLKRTGLCVETDWMAGGVAVFVVFALSFFPLLVRGWPARVFAAHGVTTTMNSLIDSSGGLTDKLGFVFSGAVYVARDAAFVGVTSGVVDCPVWSDKIKKFMPFTCTVSACVAPLMDVSNERAGWQGAGGVVAAWASCFLPAGGAAPGDCSSLCTLRDGSLRQDTYRLPDSRTFSRQTGRWKTPYGRWDVSATREGAADGEVYQGWRTYTGQTAHTQNYTLLAAAVNAVEERLNVTSVRDTHGEALVLEWGPEPVGFMRSGDLVVAVTSAVAVAAAVLACAALVAVISRRTSGPDNPPRP